MNDHKKCQKIIDELQRARYKLTPIIGNLLHSTGDCSRPPCCLTHGEYQDIVWAKNILKKARSPPTRRYNLPNSCVTVHNVFVQNTHKGEKSILVDEATILELLELYEEMGVVIRRIIDVDAVLKEKTLNRPMDGPQNEVHGGLVSDKQSSSTIESLASGSDFYTSTPKASTSKKVVSITSTNKKTSEENTTEETVLSKDSTYKKELEEKEETIKSDIEATSSITEHPSDFESDLSRPQTRSTLSALISSSNNLKQTHGTKARTSEKKKGGDDDEATVFIRIQCFTDLPNDAEDETAEPSLQCVSCKDCTSRHHLKVGGGPITLKVEQSCIEEGAIFCIDTKSDADDNDIRIVIKQCPECMSTVISSSTKIRELLGESHESITLHGIGGDESTMQFSTDTITKDICHCSESGKTCQNKCDKNTSPCICEQRQPEDEKSTVKVPSVREIKSVTESDPAIEEDGVSSPKDPSRTPSGQAKMGVIVDVDNLALSKIEVNNDESNDVETDLSAPEVKFQQPKSKQDFLKNELMPLRRRRICSSMEFDVSTAPTRLRDHEIEHENKYITIELQKLGVDQLLQACRPARCCRKAILNERQKTALPYCVSLRSLPLMGNDVEVIKQSIDMSVKKIKNTLDLTQAHKDKLAYYVSLGQDDDIKPNINFPWVVPIYSIENMKKNNKNTDKSSILKSERIFVLKKVCSSSYLQWHKSFNNVCRYFILRKPYKNNLESHSEVMMSCKNDSRALTLHQSLIHFESKNRCSNSGAEDISPISYRSRSNEDIKAGGDHLKPLLNTYFGDVKSENINSGNVSCMLDTLTMILERKLKRKPVSIDERFQCNETNKLEYYIKLMNGDIVWNNVPTLLPQNYEAYYNYTNESSNVKPPQSTFGKPNQNKVGAEVKRLPKSPMEPESVDEDWAPLVVSETSLPKIHEEVVKHEAPTTESAKPVTPEPTKAIQNQPPAPKQPEPCNEKTCETSVKEKKRVSRGLVIDITQTKEKGVVIESSACDKDICEIYKNQQFQGDKSSQSKLVNCDDKCKSPKRKNNIEIYINNKRILLDDKNRIDIVNTTKTKHSKKERKTKDS